MPYSHPHIWVINPFEWAQLLKQKKKVCLHFCPTQNYLIYRWLWILTTIIDLFFFHSRKEINLWPLFRMKMIACIIGGCISNAYRMHPVWIEFQFAAIGSVRIRCNKFSIELKMCSRRTFLGSSHLGHTYIISFRIF